MVFLHVLLHLLDLMLGQMADLTFVIATEIMAVRTNTVARSDFVLDDDKVQLGVSKREANLCTW